MDILPRLRLLAAAWLILLSGPVGAVTVKGAGGTLPAPLYLKWAKAYGPRAGVVIEYDSVGSGAGIERITQRQVDFGASDAPLSLGELNARSLVQFPTLLAGIVPVVNVSGVKSGALRLTGTVLSDIFLGRVKTWNDPAILALNRDLTLPSAAIQVLHRAEDSGTTFAFTQYLSQASPSWHREVGSGKSVKWPVGTALVGNDGVASAVPRTPSCIAYVDFGRAVAGKLALVQLQNKSGRFILPSDAAFLTASSSAPWLKGTGLESLLIDPPGPDAWPITTASFILMPFRPSDPSTALEVLRFFHWALHEGASLASESGYVSLPSSVVEVVEKAWTREFKRPDGAHLWSNK